MMLLAVFFAYFALARGSCPGHCLCVNDRWYCDDDDLTTLPHLTQDVQYLMVQANYIWRVDTAGLIRTNPNLRIVDARNQRHGQCVQQTAITTIQVYGTCPVSVTRQSFCEINPFNAMGTCDLYYVTSQPIPLTIAYQKTCLPSLT